METVTATCIRVAAYLWLLQSKLPVLFVSWEKIVTLTKSFFKIGITKTFCNDNKMFGSVNKMFGCRSKMFGCSNKKNLLSLILLP